MSEGTGPPRPPRAPPVRPDQPVRAPDPASLEAPPPAGDPDTGRVMRRLSDPGYRSAGSVRGRPATEVQVAVALDQATAGHGPKTRRDLAAIEADQRGEPLPCEESGIGGPTVLDRPVVLPDGTIAVDSTRHARSMPTIKGPPDDK
jgi:hypothetical protein